MVLLAEVVRSLQLATQHSTVVINYKLLHEASIQSRRDTLMVLMEMKQRMMMRIKSIPGESKKAPETSATGISTASQTVSSTPVQEPRRYAQLAYSPIPLSSSTRETSSSLDYPNSYYSELQYDGTRCPDSSESSLSGSFATRFSDTPNKGKISGSPKSSTDANFSPAISHLLESRGSGDRATIMKEIDEIMTTYQGLYHPSVGESRHNRYPVDTAVESEKEATHLSDLSTLHSVPALRQTKETLQIPTSVRGRDFTTTYVSSKASAIFPRSLHSAHAHDGSRSGPPLIMNARPCKANNYWGLCKGSWTTREDWKKGLKLRTQSPGMYNTKEVWMCTECIFSGDAYTATHSVKKFRRRTMMDPIIYTASSGIRYRWVFLAKSHVRKRSSGSQDEYNYGCIICTTENWVTNIYSGVETLMDHIANVHAGTMTHNTARESRAVIGNITAGEVEWDINIPFATGVVDDASTLTISKESRSLDNSPQSSVGQDKDPDTLVKSSGPASDSNLLIAPTSKNLKRNLRHKQERSYSHFWMHAVPTTVDLTRTRSAYRDTLVKQKPVVIQTTRCIKAHGYVLVHPLQQLSGFTKAISHPNVHQILGSALEVLSMLHTGTTTFDRLSQGFGRSFGVLPKTWFSQPKSLLDQRIKIYAVIVIWTRCFRLCCINHVDSSALVRVLHHHFDPGWNTYRNLEEHPASDSNCLTVHIADSTEHQHGLHGHKTHSERRYQLKKGSEQLDEPERRLELVRHMDCELASDKFSERLTNPRRHELQKYALLGNLNDLCQRFVSRRLVFWKRWIRSPPQNGHRRIEWQCVSSI